MRARNAANCAVTHGSTALPPKLEAKAGSSAGAGGGRGRERGDGHVEKENAKEKIETEREVKRFEIHRKEMETK